LVAPTCVRCIVSVALVGVSAGGSIEGEQHKRGTVLGDVSKWLFRPLGGVTDTVESFEDEADLLDRVFV
jgi:hypothetical protein